MSAESAARDVRRQAGRGITSEAAFLVSFLLGALALTRDVIRPPAYKFFAVAATAVVATVLFSAKPALNPWCAASRGRTSPRC